MVTSSNWALLNNFYIKSLYFYIYYVYVHCGWIDMNNSDKSFVGIDNLKRTDNILNGVKILFVCEGGSHFLSLFHWSDLFPRLLLIIIIINTRSGTLFRQKINNSIWYKEILHLQTVLHLSNNILFS